MIAYSIRGSHSVPLSCEGLRVWWRKIAWTTVHACSHSKLIHVMLSILRDWVTVVIKLTCGMTSMHWTHCVTVGWSVHSCQCCLIVELLLSIIVGLSWNKVGSWNHLVCVAGLAILDDGLSIRKICWGWLTAVRIVTRSSSLSCIVQFDWSR